MANRSRLFDRDYVPAWLELGWFVGKHEPYEEVLCCYCGEQYQHREHVFPYSWLERMVTPAVVEQRGLWTWIVPSCQECNLVSSAAVFLTPADKRSYIRQRLIQRHANAVKALDWSKTELRAMGPNMKTFIRRHQAEAETMRNRLAYEGKLPESIGSESLVEYVEELANAGEARVRLNGEVVHVDG